MFFFNANEWFFCECNRWIRILWWSQTSPYFKGKKNLCKRSHNLLYLNLTKCLWTVICSHLVLWQKTKVRHMMSRTTKDVPGFWLFCLLPSLCYLEMWISPQKNFCLYICYIAQLHAGGGNKRKHFTGEDAWRQTEQLCKHYYMKYVLIRLSNCWNQFHY